MTYADIILPLPLEGYFTYCVPDTLAPRLQPGCRVRVPLGKTKTRCQQGSKQARRA